MTKKKEGIMPLEVEESLTHDPEGIYFLRKNRIHRSKGANGRTKKSCIPGSNKQKLCRLRKTIIPVILTNQLRLVQIEMEAEARCLALNQTDIIHDS